MNKIRVGVSVMTLVYPNGEQKKLDGIGTYTWQLMDALKEKTTLEKILFASLRQTVKHPRRFSHLANEICLAPSPMVSQYLPFDNYQPLKNKIDVFHSTDYLVPKMKNIPVVATLHDAIMIKNHYWAGGKYRQLKNYILKSLASNANHVITISHAIKEDIMEYWSIPENKISVVYHGMSEIWFRDYGPEIKKTLLDIYKIHKPFFLVVGTLQPRKNIDRILAAYQALPLAAQKEHMLVFVGNRGWLDDASFARMMELQNKGQLLWLQHVTFLELQCLYQAAYLSLFPSLSEGFGFPILESFASKTPVITSNFGATAEIAGKAAYLINPESTEELSAAMQEVSNNTALRQQLISAGYARAKEFQWERCAQETLAAYSRAIK